MKPSFLVCFALVLCGHMAIAMSRDEIISLLQQDYTVDKVLQLLEALEAQEKADLRELDADYAENEPVLALEIQKATDLLDQKNQECTKDEVDVAALQKELDDLVKQVDSAQNNIDTNNQRIEELGDARCATNLNFIDKTGESQDATKFLKYLRGRVAEPGFVDSISPKFFFELQSAMNKKEDREILALLTKHHLTSLFEMKAATKQYTGEDNLNDVYTASTRTDEQIGTEYQDNTKAALENQQIVASSQSADDYVGQLLGYIDQLIASLQTSIESLQAAEIKAVQAFIEYRRQIQEQNRVLEKYLESANDRIVKLREAIRGDDSVQEECQGELIPLEQSVTAADNRNKAYIAAYNSRRENLVNTIALLQQVIQIYSTQVAYIATAEFKARAEDYIGDQNFDQTADFTTRQSVQDIASYNANAAPAI